MKYQDKIYDSNRNISLKPSPEELVRQKWIFDLHKLGYPKQLITVERELSYYAGYKACPKRRIDILCYGKIQEETAPLLLIECKAMASRELPLKQLIGYNALVQAPFFALAMGQDQFHLYWQGEKGVMKTNFLPSYQDLQDACKTLK